jgi:hypothetical protein
MSDWYGCLLQSTPSQFGNLAFRNFLQTFRGSESSVA